MDNKQRLGVVLAMGASAVRVGALLPLLGKTRDESWNLRDTVMAGLIPFSDYLDGYIARKTGAETSAGGYIDQTLDKLTMAAVETKLMLREELDLSDVDSRITRDIRVNKVRHDVAEKSNGNVSIDANGRGKRSTAIRMAANIISMSPLGNKFPVATKRLQKYATREIVNSGNYNIEQYSSALESYLSGRA